MNLLNAIKTIANLFWGMISALNTHLKFTYNGTTFSWLGIVFSCLVISAVVALFWKGAKG